jgi:hypothetical protein
MLSIRAAAGSFQIDGAASEVRKRCEGLVECGQFYRFRELLHAATVRFALRVQVDWPAQPSGRVIEE